MRSRSSFRRLLALLSFAGALLAAPAALAWDVAIGTGFLDSALFIGSGSGAFPTWTTIDERVRASDVPGATIPNNWVTQAWDPIAGEWPSEGLDVSEGVTQAVVSNEDLFNEFWDSSEAFVFGPVSNGDAAGAGVGYDFELTLSPFTTATIELDAFETFVIMASEPGDVGNAFAQARLFQTDVGLNDPGGVNMPLAQDAYSLAAGDPPIDTNPSFSHLFENFTNAPVTYALRFEMSASVFAVPEPTVGAALAFGALGLAGAGRMRRRTA